MNDPYGQSPTHQWGQQEDDFKPPYTQDPLPGTPYPPYGQPNLSPAAARALRRRSNRSMFPIRFQRRDLSRVTAWLLPA